MTLLDLDKLNQDKQDINIPVTNLKAFTPVNKFTGSVLDSLEWKILFLDITSSGLSQMNINSNTNNHKTIVRELVIYLGNFMSRAEYSTLLEKDICNLDIVKFINKVKLGILILYPSMVNTDESKKLDQQLSVFQTYFRYVYPDCE